MVTQLLSAHVGETGESEFAVEINVGGHILVGDLAVSDGGRGVGPTPHELLLASLGECTAMTVRWYAHRHHFPLEAVDVDLTYRKGAIEGRTEMADVFTKAVRLAGPALTREQRAELIGVAANCPIQRLMQSTPIISTTES